MNDFKAIYKCRLCGEMFEAFRPFSKHEAISIMYDITVWQKGGKASVGTFYNIHTCADGSKGFADYCGMQMQEDRKEDKDDA